MSGFKERLEALAEEQQQRRLRIEKHRSTPGKRSRDLEKKLKEEDTVRQKLNELEGLASGELKPILDEVNAVLLNNKGEIILIKPSLSGHKSIQMGVRAMPWVSISLVWDREDNGYTATGKHIVMKTRADSSIQIFSQAELTKTKYSGDYSVCEWEPEEEWDEYEYIRRYSGTSLHKILGYETNFSNPNWKQEAEGGIVEMLSGIKKRLQFYIPYDSPPQA